MSYLASCVYGIQSGAANSSPTLGLLYRCQHGVNNNVSTTERQPWVGCPVNEEKGIHLDIFYGLSVLLYLV